MLKLNQLEKNGKTLFTLSVVLCAAGALFFSTMVAACVKGGDALAGIMSFLPALSMVAGVFSACMTCSNIKKFRQTTLGTAVGWLSYGLGVGTIVASAALLAVAAVGISYALSFLATVLKVVLTII